MGKVAHGQLVNLCCISTAVPVTSRIEVDGPVGLLEVLGQMPDPRHRRGVRHCLVGIVAVALSAVLAGSRSFAAIAQWAGELGAGDLVRLGLTRAKVPDEATLGRVLTRLDGGLLDGLIGTLVCTRTTVATGRRVIAIDGKIIRGARTRTICAPHLVAAMDHTTGTILGQLAIAAKSNEIPAVRTLLASFDLATGGGVVVVTVDAMHTQTDTATAITAAGGDYVFTLKSNQPKLYAACKNVPWTDVPSHACVQIGHGRRAHRALTVLTAPAWITFAGAAQVAQIRPTTRAGKKSVEVVYLITSADHRAAPPGVLASWVRGHWGIENRAHWVRDVTFDEDRSRVRPGNSPQVMGRVARRNLTPGLPQNGA